MSGSVIFVAIDTPSLACAKLMVSSLSPLIGGVKIGLEFFIANGAAGIEELLAAKESSRLKLFLDLKLHDTPNTIKSAFRGLCNFPRIDFVTVHALGGSEMIQAAREAIDLWPERRPQLLAVTLLTSLDDEDLASIGHADVPTTVTRLAELAIDAGADGVVCSGHEVASLRKLHPDAVLMVPGIRLAPDGSDQKRVVTPRAAMDAGASYIVVGRAITAHIESLVSAVEAVIDDLNTKRNGSNHCGPKQH